MANVVVSAPGKVILSGEHSVVYGKPGLAASLYKRCRVRISRGDDNKVVLKLPDVGVQKTWSTLELDKIDPGEFDSSTVDGNLDDIRSLAGQGDGPQESSSGSQALLVFLYLYTAIGKSAKSFPSIEVTVESDIPVGAGLGSSASLSVCLSASLLLLNKQIDDPSEQTCLPAHVESPSAKSEESHTISNTGNTHLQNGLDLSGHMSLSWKREQLDIINKWAFLGEKIIHGNPSGVDNSVATYGHAVRFEAGNIQILESMPDVQILLVNTRVPRSTKALVAGVREKLQKYPDIIQPVLDSIGAITNRTEKVYSELCSSPDDQNHYKTLSDLISMNQLQLQVLDVSHPSVDEICHICQQHSLPAKLTGAGGGGCVYCLILPGTTEVMEEKLIRELQDKGYECFKTGVGGPGVLYHATGR